jgi:hypothetical protein
MSCSINLVQHRSFMQGNVIGLVALDLELRIIFAGMMRITFVFRIARVYLDYPAGHMAGFGIPADAIADPEFFAHALRSKAA